MLCRVPAFATVTVATRQLKRIDSDTKFSGMANHRSQASLNCTAASEKDYLWSSDCHPENLGLGVVRGRDSREGTELHRLSPLGYQVATT